MIKKRNLDSSLIQWIMTQTGLGPGIGEVFYVAPTASATSQFKTQLESMNVESGSIYATPTAAEAAMVAYRNDVMLVAPAAYAQTASITWDKAFSHMLGMGGPNVGGDYSEYGCALYTTTANVAEIINITGQNCIFNGLIFNNVGADADNVTAVKLDKYGCVFKDCHIAGTMAATQSAAVLANSLQIEYDGMYPIFDHCIIGQDVWSERTGANAGVILFKDGQTNGGIFRDCQILSRSETATCAFVSVVGANKLGRGWTFRNCDFNNYTTGTKMNQAFYESASNSIGDRQIVLVNCSLNGCDAWQDSDNATIVGTMPVANAAGGLVAEISDGG